LSLEQQIPVLETVHNISLLSIILELYSEIALSQKLFRIGHIYIYTFWLRMTDTMTSQNIDLSFWDTLHKVTKKNSRISLLYMWVNFRHLIIIFVLEYVKAIQVLSSMSCITPLSQGLLLCINLLRSGIHLMFDPSQSISEMASVQQKAQCLLW
jgi:hypothetical protein